VAAGLSALVVAATAKKAAEEIERIVASASTTLFALL